MWQAGLMVDFKNGTQKPIEDFDVNSSEPIEVDYVPGSSFLIPTELLKQTGLLDARYFAYFEEIDLCVQVKKLGKKVAFIPNAKILHKVGQSADSVVKFYLKNRNRMLFYSRHAKGGWFTYIFLKEFAKNLIKATVYNAKAGNIGFYKSYYLALKDFFGKKYHNGSIPKLISK
jgi:GT2 family glycosyltransferase